MEQQNHNATAQDDEMSNFDFHNNNGSIEPSVSNEEIGTVTSFDYNCFDSFGEIDDGGSNMALDANGLLDELLKDLTTVPEIQLYSSSIAAINIFQDECDLMHPTEPDDMPIQISNSDEKLELIKSHDDTLPVTRSQIERLPLKKACVPSIPLSTSVAIPTPALHQLQILRPLEDTYRPRYKSDYFPQNGSSRRPRYVADKDGNHFVSLLMPNEYKRAVENRFVRVALITTSIKDHGHFYSPYKFQTSHTDVKIPDQNPIYIPVQVSPKTNFTMKLHLVLIKSKLDQLVEAQPLKLFSDSICDIRNILQEEKLSPKDLISRYQLDKSQIAFTLCTKLSDGSYDVHSDTTVVSSVLTELPPKQLRATNEKISTTKTNAKEVVCPKCSHCFDLGTSHISTQVLKRQSSVLQPRTKKTSTSTSAKKKKKT